MSHDALRFPVGPFARPETISHADRAALLSSIRELPDVVEAICAKLNAAQWDMCYRDGGWTARQVVHHIADSHGNALFRFRLALTEDNPTIKPYLEDRWAQLADYATVDAAASLMIIRGTHQRWVALMESMAEEDWQRTFYHPQYDRRSTLESTLALYAWHGRHHCGHLQIIAG